MEERIPLNIRVDKARVHVNVSFGFFLLHFHFQQFEEIKREHEIIRSIIMHAIYRAHPVNHNFVWFQCRSILFVFL